MLSKSLIHKTSLLETWILRDYSRYSTLNSQEPSQYFAELTEQKDEDSNIDKNTKYSLLDQ